jgi:hypothetical protein
MRATQNVVEILLQVAAPESPFVDLIITVCVEVVYTGNLAPGAATTMTTDNPIMSGTHRRHRRLPLWLVGVVQHPLEAM